MSTKTRSLFRLPQKAVKERKHRRVNRSWYGSLLLFLFLAVCAFFTAMPLIYSVVTAFKPLSELWRFPPTLFTVNNPTLNNFLELWTLMSNSWVPLTRYLFNTVFITLCGTAGHVIFASMCAYPLAKHRFPGKALYLRMITLSLMFNAAVTGIPNYLTMSKLGWIDTYMAMIVPAFGSSLGVYLIVQFMSQIPDSIFEAGKIDGANEWVLFWRLMMPQVKPAWLTAMIFSVQSLWNMGANSYIYSESIKTLPYALSQVVAGGIARAGVAAAVTVILMIVPIVIFVVSQSNIILTMTSSGMKE